MDLTTRQLAWLHHEMEEVLNSDRPDEDKAIASSIYGRAQGELEWEEQQQYNGTPSEPDAEQLFS